MSIRSRETWKDTMIIKFKSKYPYIEWKFSCYKIRPKEDRETIGLTISKSIITDFDRKDSGDNGGLMDYILTLL